MAKSQTCPRVLSELEYYSQRAHISQEVAVRVPGGGAKVRIGSKILRRVLLKEALRQTGLGFYVGPPGMSVPGRAAALLAMGRDKRDWLGRDLARSLGMGMNAQMWAGWLDDLRAIAEEG